MERADLGAGRLRRREDLGIERAAGVDHGLPAVQPDSPASGAMASSGTATMTSSTSSRSACGSANARTPSTSDRNRSRRPASGWRPPGPASRPGQGDAEGRPDGPRPDDPDDRRLARVGVPVGDGSWSLSWTSSPWRWSARRAGSRSMPAGLDRRPRSRRRVARLGSSAGAARPRPSSAARPRTVRDASAVRFHPSSVASQRGRDALPAIDPFGARASPRRGPAGRLPAGRALGDRIDLDRPRSRSRSCSRTCSATPAAASSRGRRRDARRVAAGPRRRGRDPVHARRA